MLIFIRCNYHTACLKTSLLSHLPCLNKIDSRSAPAKDKRAFRRDVNECCPLRRGLFVLWGGGVGGGLGRKKKRARGARREGEREKRGSRLFPLPIAPRAVLLGILGGGVPPGSSNPNTISDQKNVIFSHPFSD